MTQGQLTINFQIPVKSTEMGSVLIFQWGSKCTHYPFTYISYPAMYIWQLRNATRRLANRQATVSLTLLRTKSKYDLRNYDETRHGF